jgi:DNA-binding transcriptional ArsR family regulator
LSRNPEEIRDEIARVIAKYEEADPHAQISAREVANQTGMTEKEVNYHLDLLREAGQVEIFESPSDRSYGEFAYYALSLTPTGRRRAREGVRGLSPATSPQYIGVLVQGDVTSGNIQGVAQATEAQVSQVVSDPGQFAEQLQKTQELLLDTVRQELSAVALAQYKGALEELVDELQSAQPDEGTIKRTLRVLSFYADIEGTLGLMTRVLPVVHVFLTIANRVLGTG